MDDDALEVVIARDDLELRHLARDPRSRAVQLGLTGTIVGMEGTFSLIPAESGWRALFAEEDGTETGRSRVIAWGSHELAGETRIVGIIADPNDPKELVPADGVVDEDGGSLLRYAYVG